MTVTLQNIKDLEKLYKERFCSDAVVLLVPRHATISDEAQEYIDDKQWDVRKSPLFPIAESQKDTCYALQAEYINNG